MSARTTERVRRLRPGAHDPGLWALGPSLLRLGEARYAPAELPALATGEPEAVAWLGLSGDDLVLFGPYGDTAAWTAIVEGAQTVARDTGRARLLAPVRNDEIERFDGLQRLGFALSEVRLGVWAAGDDSDRHEQRFLGEIAARDELLLVRAVPVR